MHISTPYLLAAVALVAVPGLAEAQVRVAPLAIRPTSDVTVSEQIAQLSAQVAQLQARLASDEAKLQQAAQTASDAKLAVAIVNKGLDYQFKTMSADLAALRTAYQNHTHKYAKHSVGFTNIPINGTYVSLIQKNVDTYEPTTPPQ